MKEQTNKITLIGTVVENKLRQGTAKTGPHAGLNYISGEIILKCVLDGADNFIPVNFYTFEITKTKAPSKLYGSYKKIAVGQRLEISGFFSENRFWSEKTGQIASSQKVSGRFVNQARPGTNDTATFELSGFVSRSLTEKLDKQNKLYAYELLVGQTNYNDTSASLFRFHISPEKEDIARIVRDKYIAGATVHFFGDIRYTTTTVTKELSNNIEFGEPKVSSLVMTNKNYFITSGEAPITGDTAYSLADIQRYKSAIAVRDVEIQQKAKDSGKTSKTDKTPSQRATSLI